MAGLAERRGPTADSFWTWREVMYRFLDRVSPEDVEAIAAFAYLEMLESGFTTVGEFHYLHHDVDGRPYADVGEMAARIATAAAETRIGLTLLPSFYAYGGFGAAAPARANGDFSTIRSGFSDWWSARAPSSRPCRQRVSASPRIRCARSLRTRCGLYARPAPRVRSISMPANRPGRSRRALRRSAAVPCSGSWTMRDRSPLVRDPRHPHHRGGATRAGGIGSSRRPLSAHRGIARRRHLRRRRLCGGRRADSASEPIPIFRSMRRPSCGSWSMDNDFRAGHAMCSLCRRANRPGAGSSTARLPAGRRRAAPDRRARVGRRADIVLLDAGHPDLASRHGDQWLDAWIFVAGRTAVSTVVIGGEIVVEAGRHRSGRQSRPATGGSSVLSRDRDPFGSDASRPAATATAAAPMISSCARSSSSAAYRSSSALRIRGTPRGG